MKKTVVLFSLLPFLFFQSFTPQDPSNVSGELRVTFINVGQADAIFIHCPTKEHSMLIDAGDTRYPGSSKKFKEAMQKLLPSQGKIDVVIGSHPHADHLGSMNWVFKNYSVSKYVDDGVQYESSLYNGLMETVYEQSNSGTVKYETAEDAEKDFVDFCPAKNLDAEIILPRGGYEDCSNPNDCSVIVKVTYEKTSFLFVGDAEIEEENELLGSKKTKKDLNADVLKAGHHGSNTSSSLGFVRAVSPEIVVVSVGEKNVGTNKGYKHPQVNSINSFNAVLKTTAYRDAEIEAYDKTTKKWVKKQVKDGVYFTVLDGDVVILSDGKKVWKEK